MICNKYELLEKIGQGTFSQIYKGRNIRTGELIAIKIEPKTVTIKLLQNETRIYKYLNAFLHSSKFIHEPPSVVLNETSFNHDRTKFSLNEKSFHHDRTNFGLNEARYQATHIPTMKWFGVDSTNYYMVISLLGKSLESFKREQPTGHISLSTTLYIGIQMVRLLKIIHTSQLIHRDVKPDNFLFGVGAADQQLHMIDFGFCKKYNSNLFPSKTSNIIGTPKFASIAAHELNELSRKDDLESVGYILIYLFMGELAWDNILDNNIIKIMKLHMIEFENTEIPPVFINYLINVRKIAFHETPNYEKLLSILTHDTNN
jgi:serine/threonine protein kinase